VSKFRIGDKVVIIDTFETERTDHTGVIIDDDRSGNYPLKVRFDTEIDGDTEEWFNHKDLEYTKSFIINQILSEI
jgi:hypothetical protein